MARENECLDERCTHSFRRLPPSSDDASSTPTSHFCLMPRSSETDAMSQPTVRGRQACDECRRRKLRCDGQQPQCRVCRETGVVCEITQRAVRGPKKGHLKALKNRVLHLEAMLEGRFAAHQRPNDFTGNARGGNAPTPSESSVDVDDNVAIEATELWIPHSSAPSGPEREVFLSTGFVPTLPAFNSHLPPTPILHTELYGRTHPPLI